MQSVNWHGQALPMHAYGVKQMAHTVGAVNPFDTTTRPQTLIKVLRFAANSGDLITLATYNTHNFYPREKNPKSPESIEALARVIRSVDADIIGMQEVGDKAFLEEFNQTELNGRYSYIYTSRPNRYGSHVAIMAKSHLELVDYTEHRPRILEAIFRTPSGYEFAVLAVHYPSMLTGEAETHDDRKEIVRHTVAIMRRHWKVGRDVFVLGDLNIYPYTRYGREILRMLCSPDGQLRLKEPMLPKGGGAPATHRGKGRIPDTKLDYVLIPTNQTVMRAYTDGDLRQLPHKLASDHLPVVVKAKVQQQATRKPAHVGGRAAFSGTRIHLIA